MRINEAGLQLIKDSEGCKLSAYRCPVGVLTIGYGSTGPHVKEGMIITQQQADELLMKDLVRFEEGVTKLVKSKINENQFSALVSFAFNLGLGSLESSTLLKKVNANPNDHTISFEFSRWNKAAGKVLTGLIKRRQAESKLYFSKE